MGLSIPDRIGTQWRELGLTEELIGPGVATLRTGLAEYEIEAQIKLVDALVNMSKANGVLATHELVAVSNQLRRDAATFEAGASE
jgi:hypothetical protein